MKMQEIKKRYWLFLFLLVGLIWLGIWREGNKMKEMPKGLVEFDVAGPIPSCGRWKDKMPASRDSDTFRIYMNARKTFRSKFEYQLSKKELEIVRDSVNIAAKSGDWGAKALLAKFYREGLGSFEYNKVLDKAPENAVSIYKEAVDAGQPWGYYDLGVAYEYGYGGVPYDLKIAWAYYLKAAKLGSPDAQMALSQAYKKSGRRAESKMMLECAYQQGHGAAAYELGLVKDVSGEPEEALKLYHDGVKFGSERCASTLNLIFSIETYADETLKPLGFTVDAERARRYELIEGALKINPDLRFSRLDAVLPLPPKPLPEWQGLDAAMSQELEGLPTY